MENGNWFVRCQGKVLGPFEWARVRSLRDKGVLTPADQISSDRRSWALAESMAELFPPQVQSVPSQQDDQRDANWYYAHRRRNVGPLTFAALQQLVTLGRVKPSTMIWNEKNDLWKTASSIPGLSQEATPVSPRQDNSQTRRQYIGIIAASIAAATGVGSLAYFIGRRESTPGGIARNDNKEEKGTQEKEHTAQSKTITKSSQKVPTQCKKCNGSGVCSVDCSTCNASGKVQCSNYETSLIIRTKTYCNGGYFSRQDRIDTRDPKTNKVISFAYVNRQEACSVCSGTGKQDCSTCSGKRKVEQTCDVCMGLGHD